MRLAAFGNLDADSPEPARTGMTGKVFEAVFYSAGCLQQVKAWAGNRAK